MADTFKLPTEVTREFLISIRYRYGNQPRLLFEAKGRKTKPSLEKGKIYWVPEKYRIVNSAERGKLIQYHGDGLYKAKKPEWVEATKMKKAYSRYAFECVGVEEKKLNKLTRKEVVLNGTFEERIPQKIDNDITDEFKKKPYEIWRFKNTWDKYADDGSQWSDNPEVFVYSVVVHRINAQYHSYADFNWSERNK